MWPLILVVAVSIGLALGIRRRVIEKRLIGQYGPLIEQALLKLDGVPSIMKLVRELEQDLLSGAAALCDGTGEIVNLCPKCGQTLRVRGVRTWREDHRQFECPARGCYYRRRVSTITAPELLDLSLAPRNQRENDERGGV